MYRIDQKDLQAGYCCSSDANAIKLLNGSTSVSYQAFWATDKKTTPVQIWAERWGGSYARYDYYEIQRKKIVRKVCGVLVGNTEKA